MKNLLVLGILLLVSSPLQVVAQETEGRRYCRQEYARHEGFTRDLSRRVCMRPFVGNGWYLDNLPGMRLIVRPQDTNNNRLPQTRKTPTRIYRSK